MATGSAWNCEGCDCRERKEELAMATFTRHWIVNIAMLPASPEATSCHRKSYCCNPDKVKKDCPNARSLRPDLDILVWKRAQAGRDLIASRKPWRRSKPRLPNTQPVKVCSTLEKTPRIEGNRFNTCGVLVIRSLKAAVICTDSLGNVAVRKVKQMAKQQAGVRCEHLGIIQVKGELL